MSSVVIVQCEGVLSAPNGGSLANANIIPAGVELYNALAEKFRSMMLITACHDPKVVEAWCIAYHIVMPFYIISPVMTDRYSQLGAMQDALGRAGAHPVFYVGSDPLTVQETLKIGITSLLFTHPRNTLVDFRPGPRSTWVNDTTWEDGPDEEDEPEEDEPEEEVDQ